MPTKKEEEGSQRERTERKEEGMDAQLVFQTSNSKNG